MAQTGSQNTSGERYNGTSSYFGFRDNKPHDGPDIYGHYIPVYPIMKGEVTLVHNTVTDARGKYVIVKHEPRIGNNGKSYTYYSLYQHLDSISVERYETVYPINDPKAKKVGISGKTGGDYAPHLHLNVYRGNPGPNPYKNNLINPLRFYHHRTDIRGADGFNHKNPNPMFIQEHGNAGDNWIFNKNFDWGYGDNHQNKANDDIDKLKEQYFCADYDDTRDTSNRFALANETSKWYKFAEAHKNEWKD